MGHLINYDKHTYQLWPKAVIPYVIRVTQNKARVDEAIKKWNKANAGFRFIRWNGTTPDYICFETNVNLDGGVGGNSNIGRVGGKQIIRLSAGAGLPIILHEIGHALGFYHEHQRADRDEKVEIFRDKIKKKKLERFEKKSDDKKRPTDYDFYSIMHYHFSAFAEPPGSIVMWPKVRGIDHDRVGTASELYEEDILSARKLASAAKNTNFALITFFVESVKMQLVITDGWISKRHIVTALPKHYLYLAILDLSGHITTTNKFHVQLDVTLVHVKTRDFLVGNASGDIEPDALGTGRLRLFDKNKEPSSSPLRFYYMDDSKRLDEMANDSLSENDEHSISSFSNSVEAVGAGYFKDYNSVEKRNQQSEPPRPFAGSLAARL